MVDFDTKILTHYHVDLDNSIMFCRYDRGECPVIQSKQKQEQGRSSIFFADSRNSMGPSKFSNKNDFVSEIDREKLMHKYYEHDQDKMTSQEIYALKCVTFPYLDKDDIRLRLSDRSIINKELDLNTASILNETEKPQIRELLYSLRSCISSHDNSSANSKNYVSLKPVALKPFYNMPYLTHER